MSVAGGCVCSGCFLKRLLVVGVVLAGGEEWA